MSTNTPTNRSLTVSRAGTDVLTNLAALVLPARPETIAMRELPAGKAFEIYFDSLQTIREGDRLINEADVTEHYRVTGVSHFDTPRNPHTEIIAEGRLGS